MLLPDGGLHSLLQLGSLFIMPDSWFLAFLVAFFMLPCCMRKSKQTGVRQIRDVVRLLSWVLANQAVFRRYMPEAWHSRCMNDRGTTELRAKKRYLSNFRKLVSHLSRAATKDRDMPPCIWTEFAPWTGGKFANLCDSRFNISLVDVVGPGRLLVARPLSEHDRTGRIDFRQKDRDRL